MPAASAIAGALLLALPLAGCAAGGTLPEVDPWADRSDIRMLRDPRIHESSGLARSGHDSDRLWTHNDFGNAPVLFALSRRSGETLGRFTVRSTFNIDWEDLAYFEDEGRPALLIGDVGDNWAVRPHVSLHVVHEPESVTGDGVLVPVRSIRFRYPDGPRDVEALAVDGATRRVYLVSKRDDPPRLYALSLDGHAVDAVAEAEALGEVNRPLPARPSRPAWRDRWVTAMDVDARGRRAVLVTLTQAHIYDRRAGESWAETLSRTPRTIDLPRLPQIEAVALSPEGDRLWLTSETLPAPLAEVRLPPCC